MTSVKTFGEMSWFQVRAVADDVWLIGEPGHVNSWLIAGADSAALIDTGLGVASIRAMAERLTPLPLRVVNTHSHLDHVGGNHEFARIAIHKLGAAALADQRLPDELLADYMRHTKDMLGAQECYRALDERFFHMLTGDAAPRPLPADFDPAQWTLRPSRATETLADGDRIDLGRRTLTVLHTPGHSADGICLLDEEAGLLFAGDTVATGPIYAHFPDADLDALEQSATRLAALGDQVRLVLVSHWGQAVTDPMLLTETRDGLQRLVAGEVTLRPAHDLHGNPVREARFERFAVLVAG